MDITQDDRQRLAEALGVALAGITIVWSAELSAAQTRTPEASLWGGGIRYWEPEPAPGRITLLPGMSGIPVPGTPAGYLGAECRAPAGNFLALEVFGAASWDPRQIAVFAAATGATVLDTNVNPDRSGHWMAAGGPLPANDRYRMFTASPGSGSEIELHRLRLYCIALA